MIRRIRCFLGFHKVAWVRQDRIPMYAAYCQYCERFVHRER